jgi:polysaccharide pyruvyl transferase WcaK-like protein
VKTIHIGHHFFGSGNIGDDLMLAGFLEGIKASTINLTCCIPHPIENVAKRFPSIKWQTYTPENRSQAIRQCDLWLGLGGSPFQSTVSDWFISHLESEYNYCQLYNKPMAFIGIGSQDAQAFDHPMLQKVFASAVAIWTRDSLTYNTLKRTNFSNKCYLSSDLAHIYLNKHSLGPRIKGQLAVALNFDYQDWPNLTQTIAALSSLPLNEQLWLIQETRPLPGSEQWLYLRMPPDLQKKWRTFKLDELGQNLDIITSKWPSSEWLVSSRFHTTLVAAWAGTKCVVINTNTKLLSVALEYGYQALNPDSTAEEFIDALQLAKAPPLKLMQEKAVLAQKSVDQLIAQFEL